MKNNLEKMYFKLEKESFKNLLLIVYKIFRLRKVDEKICLKNFQIQRIQC